MSQRLIILQALRDAGERGITNGELALGQHILRYSARIHELRRRGHIIRTINEPNGCVRFILEHDAERDSGTRPAASPAAPVDSPPAAVSLDTAPPEPGEQQLFPLDFDELSPPDRYKDAA